MPPRLRRISGESAEDQIELKNFPFTIGRDQLCDLCLTSSYVSRRHARIEKQGKDYYLIDLDSTSGTYVNGRKIKSHILDNGDIIEVGDISFRFETGLPIKKYLPHIEKKKEKGVPYKKGSAGIKTYLFLYVIPVLIMVMLILSIIAEQRHRKILRSELITEGYLLVENLAVINRTPLIKGEEALLDIKRILQYPITKEAYIVDQYRRILKPVKYYHQSIKNSVLQEAMNKATSSYKSVVLPGAKGTLFFVAPIIDDKLKIVGFALLQIKPTINSIWGFPFLIAILILSVVATLIVSFLFVKQATKGFKSLTRQLEEAIENERQQIDYTRSFTEIENIIDLINGLLKSRPVGSSSKRLKVSKKEMSTDDNMLRMIMESSSHGILIIDDDQRIFKANQKAINILGFPKECEGQSVFSLIPDKEILKNMINLMKRALQEHRKTIKGEIKIENRIFKVIIVYNSEKGLDMGYTILSFLNKSGD